MIFFIIILGKIEINIIWR